MSKGLQKALEQLKKEYPRIGILVAAVVEALLEELKPKTKTKKGG